MDTRCLSLEREHIRGSPSSFGHSWACLPWLLFSFASPDAFLIIWNSVTSFSKPAKNQGHLRPFRKSLGKCSIDGENIQKYDNIKCLRGQRVASAYNLHFEYFANEMPNSNFRSCFLFRRNPLLFFSYIIMVSLRKYSTPCTRMRSSFFDYKLKILWRTLRQNWIYLCLI